MATSIAEYLDQEVWPWEKKAKEELGDDPEQRAEKLVEMKAIVQAYAEKHEDFRPLMEDNFLMMFLRTRKFDVERAFDCLIKFHKARLCNPKAIFPSGKGPLDYRNVFDKPISYLIRRRNPLDGSLIQIWSFRNYNTSEDELEDCFVASLVVLLEALQDSSIQTHGVRIIFDLKGISLSILASLMSNFQVNKAALMIHGAFPSRFKGFHAVNDPTWVTKPLWGLFGPFLNQKARERVHFHGTDFEDLHKHIAPEILPDIFQGTGDPFDSTDLGAVLYSMNEEIVRKSFYGFVNKVVE